ncbi:Xaa-Pro aminopeptidase [Bradyrhizobium elkanii]|nr:Xaa-Pro aminopeptidase [Bradyrhizobium elkanii]
MRRLAAVKFEMRRRDIDTLVVTEESDTAYLSGHTYRSGARPQALVVSMNVEEPTFILRKSDAAGCIYQTFMERDRVIGYPEDFVGNSEKDGYDAVVDFIHNSGLANRTVAIEIRALSTPTIEKFRRRLANAKIVDSARIVSWTRIVKSRS